MLGAILTVSALGKVVAPHTVPDYQSELSEEFQKKLVLNKQKADQEALEKAKLKRLRKQHYEQTNTNASTRTKN